MAFPSLSIDTVLASFVQLEQELAQAQQGAMDPRLRAELARLATCASGSVANLEAAHRQAMDSLQSKQRRGKALAAENKRAITKKKAQATQEKRQPAKQEAPADKPVAIDPALGIRLAKQLLKRQAVARPTPVAKPAAGSLLDDWEPTPKRPATFEEQHLSGADSVAEPQISADH